MRKARTLGLQAARHLAAPQGWHKSSPDLERMGRGGVPCLHYSFGAAPCQTMASCLASCIIESLPTQGVGFF